MVLASTYPRWKGDPEPGFVHQLTRRLTERFEVVVLGPRAPGAAPDEVLDGVRIKRYRYAPAQWETLVNDGGIVANLRKHPLKWLLVPAFVVAQILVAARLVKQWRPDVIHAHWLLPQGLALALLSVIDRQMPPFIVTSHGTDLFSLNAWPLQALKRFVARRAKVLTVVSSPMVDELRRVGVDTDKVRIEPMGVDLAGNFKPDSANVRSSGEILFVGRLVKGKGLHHLIDALPPVLERNPAAHLTVAGFGPEEKTLRAQVARLGLERSVNFLGAVRQEDLPDLYRRAAVSVLPFTPGAQEGLGLVLIEAVGCGCPVIAGDVPAVRDVIDSRVGAIVPLGDPDALIEAVCAVLAAPVADGRERAEAVAHFDWSVRARSYADLLEAQVNR